MEGFSLWFFSFLYIKLKKKKLIDFPYVFLILTIAAVFLIPES